jgi:hypothetical protein
MSDSTSKSSPNCGVHYATAWRCHNGVTQYIAFRMRCKSWDCPTCRRVKSRFYKRVIRDLFEGQQLYFYTLTYYHSSSPREAWKTYNRAWNRFRTTVTQRYGEMRYVRVLECHKQTNYPHLHVITDKYIPPAEYGKLAVSSGFGWSNNWARIDNKAAAGYVSKYLTKEWPRSDSSTLRREFSLRIITGSAGLFRKPPKFNPWKLLKRNTNFADCIDCIRFEVDYHHDKSDLSDFPIDECDFFEYEASGCPYWMVEAADAEKILYEARVPQAAEFLDGIQTRMILQINPSC